MKHFAWIHVAWISVAVIHPKAWDLLSHVHHNLLMCVYWDGVYFANDLEEVLQTPHANIAPLYHS